MSYVLLQSFFQIPITVLLSKCVTDTGVILLLIFFLSEVTTNKKKKNMQICHSLQMYRIVTRTGITSKCIFVKIAHPCTYKLMNDQ